MGIKRVYYGPFNNSKSEEFYNTVLGKIKNGKEENFYYILPNGKLLTTYREKIIDSLGGFLNLNLFTFDDVVKEILKDENHIEIDENTKKIILTKIVRESKLDHLDKVSDLSGFIKTLGNIIGEIKRSIVIPEDFIKLSPKNILYKEIGSIYMEYEKYLKDRRLVDREGQYILAVEKLKEDVSFLSNIEEIIIDQFYNFRPIELQILKEISKSRIDIHINIPFRKVIDLGIIKNTLESLKDIGFTLEKMELDKENKLEEVFFIEEEYEKIENINLNIIQADTMELEIKKIFEKIKKKISEGYKYSDILIVPMDDEYIEKIGKRSIVEKLPISIQIQDKMINNNFIVEILELFLIKTNNNKNSILNRFQNKYFINKQDQNVEYDIYPFLKRIEFDSLEELLEEISRKKEFELEADYIDYLICELEEIEEEVSDLKLENTIKKYNQYIRDIIQKYNIGEKINSIMTYSEEKFYMEMKSYIRLYEMLEEMEILSELFGVISIDDYYDLLVSKLEEEEITLIPGNSKGIQILDLIDIRGIDYKIAYIIGLSENNYPNIEEDNFFINERNYKDLKSMNIDIKSHTYKLENEIIKFSTLISCVKEELNFTYSKGAEDESIASMFLDEIIRICEEDIKYIDVSFQYMIKENINEITTNKELSDYILKLNYEDNDINKDYISYHNLIYPEKLKIIQDKIDSDYNRNLDTFTKYSGILSESREITRDLEEMHKNKVYSSSYLERYINCPFSFLMGRIFKVDEYIEEIKEYDPMLIGNIYHSVLKDFYERYRKDIKEYVISDEYFELEDKKDLILDLILKYGLEDGLDLNSRKSQLLVEDINDRIFNFIKNDIERIKNHALIPIKFEEEFGYEEKMAIYNDNRELLLNGKIDRIDRTKDSKSIIMDYKSGSSGIANLNSIEEGYSLQIPIYLLAEKDNNPVAALYGIINQNEFRVTLGVLGETTIITNRHGGKLESIEDLEKITKNTEKTIFQIEEKILNGEFPVEPYNCPDYCLYKDICRYREQVEIEI